MQVTDATTHPTAAASDVTASCTPGASGFDDGDLAKLQASAERACALLKALAHTDRLLLLCRLTQGEFCVGELEADLGIRQPSLSQQLGVLRQEGLVETRRNGKHIHYRLASEDALAILQVLHERLCAPATPSPKAQPKDRA